MKTKTKTVSKNELAEALVRVEGITYTQAKRIITLLIEQTTLILAEGKVIDLMGFAKIYGKYVKERVGSHPKTKEPIMIDPTVRLKVEVSSKLKRVLGTEINRFKAIEDTGEVPETEAYKLMYPAQESTANTMSKNSPNRVRQSMQDYLKYEFVESMPWVHPVTGEMYSHQLIGDKLKVLKKAKPECYKAIYAMWTTNISKTIIADKYYCSQSTIKRRWDSGISTLLLLVLYPELEPETVVYDFYYN